MGDLLGSPRVAPPVLLFWSPFFGPGTLGMGSDAPVSFGFSSFNYRRARRGPPSGAG
jgi:hypothetical protein